MTSGVRTCPMPRYSTPLPTIPLDWTARTVAAYAYGRRHRWFAWDTGSDNRATTNALRLRDFGLEATAEHTVVHLRAVTP